MRKKTFIIFAVFSLAILLYGIGFIIDYFLIIKYSIEDGLPWDSSDVVLPKNERLNEINTLITYALFVIFYAISVLFLIIHIGYKNKKNNPTTDLTIQNQ